VRRYIAGRNTRPPGRGWARGTEETVVQRELGAALARPGTTLGGACERVTQALRQHGEDDITLVLARMRQ
jgi:hypothetical protein